MVKVCLPGTFNVRVPYGDGQIRHVGSRCGDVLLCISGQAAQFGIELLLLALATVILEGSRGRVLEILHSLL